MHKNIIDHEEIISSTVGYLFIFRKERKRKNGRTISPFKNHKKLTSQNHKHDFIFNYFELSDPKKKIKEVI